jgi:hypothetical protein
MEHERRALAGLTEMMNTSPDQFGQEIQKDILGWGLANLERWLTLESSEPMLNTLRHNQPFGLYLRAYATEGFDEIAAEDQQLSFPRSIELANVVAVSEHLPVYGLHNKSDINLLPSTSRFGCLPTIAGSGWRSFGKWHVVPA